MDIDPDLWPIAQEHRRRSRVLAWILLALFVGCSSTIILAECGVIR